MTGEGMALYGVTRDDLARMELEAADREIGRLQLELSMARADNARLRANMGKPRIVPTGDEEYGYECPNHHCHAPLEQDFEFCPGCGCEIDWRSGWVEPEDAGAYDRRFDR